LLNTEIWKNLAGMLLPPRAEPFPGVIGTFMARDAFSVAAAYLGLGREDVILLPAYACKEVIKPFVGRCQMKFYDVNIDLTVDPVDIERHLKNDHVRLLVIINYFGFLQPWRQELATLCARHGVVLLEDCAHSLLTDGSGDTGDLAVFSFRKMLPVADGGGLRIKNAAQPPTVKFHPRLYSNVLSSLAIVKSLSNVQSETLSRAGLSTDPLKTPIVDGDRQDDRVLPLSWFAYNGISHVSFEDIAERRRRDYGFWQQLAGSANITPVFAGLDGGVCPLGFPIRTKRRDDLKRRLEELGLTVKVHWHLPSVVDATCRNSIQLSQEMMTLPVFPELSVMTRRRVAGAWPGLSL
jgi:dTDP-4-amino-4,6-dideoxygalactose transaminase